MVFAMTQSHLCSDVQSIYSVRVGNPDAWAMFSLATSWWAFGITFGKIIVLKDMLPYRSKQARKVKALMVMFGRNGTELTILSQSCRENIELTSAKPLRALA